MVFHWSLPLVTLTITKIKNVLCIMSLCCCLVVLFWMFIRYFSNSSTSFQLLCPKNAFLTSNNCFGVLNFFFINNLQLRIMRQHYFVWLSFLNNELKCKKNKQQDKQRKKRNVLTELCGCILLFMNVCCWAWCLEFVLLLFSFYFYFFLHEWKNCCGCYLFCVHCVENKN